MMFFLPKSKLEARRNLYGWVPYTPLVVLVFAVLAINARVNVQNRRDDYEFFKLTTERRKAAQELDAVRAEEALLNDLDMLSAKAQELGLVPPLPNQVETVVVRPGVPLPALPEAPSSVTETVPAGGGITLAGAAPESAPAPATVAPSPVQAAAGKPRLVVLDIPNEKFDELDESEAALLAAL